jgi:hypothetical protein
MLSNGVYQRDSGFYQKVESDLNKLSTDTLESLGMIIRIREQEAVERAREEWTRLFPNI